MTVVYAPNKTNQTALLIWQDVASATYTEGSALDVSGKFAATGTIKIGRRSGTAFTAGSPVVRIQGSVKSSGNDQWTDLFTYTPQIGASIANTTANGAISANAATFVVTSATNIAASDLLFLGHTTTPANYELIRALSLASTTVTPAGHNVVNAHDTGCVITDQAEEVPWSVDLSGFLRLRATIDNIGSGQNIAVEVACTTYDSVTGT